MNRRVLAAALAAAPLALVAALSVGGAGAQTILPDCAPGTPAPAPPTAAVTGDPSSPARLIAGRPINIEYDSPGAAVSVQSTTGPPGTVVDGGQEAIAVTVPSAGTIPLTVRYFDTISGTCVHSFTFTMNVEPGSLLPAGLGVAQGDLGRAEFARLPRRGVNPDEPPSVGLRYGCNALQAVVPLIAVVREERDLRRSPSPASHTLQLQIPDPCQSRSASAVSPGIALRFLAGGDFDEGDRIFALEHRTRAARRYHLQVLQGSRVLGSLRYYVAFRPQNAAIPKLWVVAPEAAFERARCTRPKRPAPLGYKRYPFPPCPRRG